MLKAFPSGLILARELWGCIDYLGSRFFGFLFENNNIFLILSSRILMIWHARSPRYLTKLRVTEPLVFDYPSALSENLVPYNLRFSQLKLEILWENASSILVDGKARPDNIRILWMFWQIKKNISQHNLCLYWLSQTTKAFQWEWKFTYRRHRVFRQVNAGQGAIST